MAELSSLLQPPHSPNLVEGLCFSAKKSGDFEKESWPLGYDIETYRESAAISAAFATETTSTSEPSLKPDHKAYLDGKNTDPVHLASENLVTATTVFLAKRKIRW